MKKDKVFYSGIGCMMISIFVENLVLRFLIVLAGIVMCLTAFLEEENKEEKEKKRKKSHIP